ncbi:hypothetical protein F4818DRAFT_400936 [Hypoxylon cercidicola]|nr:hypothetical protein F4818DRAFT_400936 [Hypoxylon cercidicola]
MDKRRSAMAFEFPFNSVSSRFLAMCLFAYPAPKPKKSKKAKRPTATTKATSNDYIQKDANEAYPAMSYSPGAAGTPYPYWYYYPHGMEQWLDEDRPAYITKGQWTSQSETLKGTFDAAQANGKKIDETKTSLSTGIKDTHDAIKDTQAAVKGVHDTLKETCDTIKKNYGECSNKQDGCAAEIGKVRKYLEDEAKQREEAYQRQQDMRDAWYYSQLLRQAERDAETSSTRSRSSSKSSKSGSSDKSHRRRARFDDSYEAERRHYEYLRKFFGEAQPPHPFPQAHPPWAGRDAWQHPIPPFGPEDFHPGHAAGGFGQRNPPRPPFNPFMPNGPPGHSPRRHRRL